MELAELVARRRMVRRYLPEPVDLAVVARILDRARRAPSAGFSQGQTFVVVTDPARRSELARLCDEGDYVARGFEPWLSVAPVHVVVCTRPAAYAERYAEPDKAAPHRPADWRVRFWWVDGGAALMLLLLAAVDEGLGAGFLDLARPEEVKSLLGIPADVAPLGLVTLGHPHPDQPVTASERRGRRPYDEVVRFERW